MNELAAGIAAAGQAIGLVKQMVDLDRELGKAELKSRLADILTKSAETKIALADAQLEIHRKDQELAALRDAAKAPAKTMLHRGFPFTCEGGQITAGPYCPNCYERQALVLLGRKSAVLKACARCKGEYQHAPLTNAAQEALDQSNSVNATVPQG